MPWRKPGARRRALVITGTAYAGMGVAVALAVAVTSDVLLGIIILGLTAFLVGIGLWLTYRLMVWYDRLMDKPWGRR